MLRLLAALLGTLMLLATSLAPALAEPLAPGYFLPGPDEMLSGFELTEATEPHFNQPGTAYQELRTYRRTAPFAILGLIAAISPNQTMAHERMAVLVGNFVAGGYSAIPSTQGDESTSLWKLGPQLDTYILIWRSGPVLGSIEFISPSGSTSPHDAGYQMGLVARPMLDRMQAYAAAL